MYAQAVAEMTRARELNAHDWGVVGWLGHAYAVAGKRGEAQKVLAELKEREKQGNFSAYKIAQIYAGLRQLDQAFSWLEKAFAQHEAEMALFKVEPMLDPLRSDERYANLLRRMGLPP